MSDANDEKVMTDREQTFKYASQAKAHLNKIEEELDDTEGLQVNFDYLRRNLELIERLNDPAVDR